MKRISRLARFAVAAYCFLPVASVSAGGAAAECPDLDLVDRTWVEHAGTPAPNDVLETHMATPRTSASPMLVPVTQAYYWLGISVRNPYGVNPVPALSCYLLGSVAYYNNGIEGNPELDMVKEISEGREPQLRDRLVELRWFDPKENKKHRWFNVALARSLGWFTYANGTQDENLRPIPLPPVPNSLDIAQAAGARQQPDSNPKPERNAPTGVIESARNWGDALLDKKED
ncbi:MAG: hypothetical protein AAB268_12280 [Elusimicrobiota bacterium]